MQLSRHLSALKKKAIINMPVEVILNQKLAQELFALRSKNNRLLNLDAVWFWAFMYYSNTVKLHFKEFDFEIFYLDSQTNKLLDGGHRLGGFITSGVKEMKCYIVFHKSDPFEFIDFGELNVGKLVPIKRTLRKKYLMTQKDKNEIKSNV